MTPAREEWRPIPGWEGYYEASDLGRIRSVERTVHAGRGRYRRNPSKVLAPQSHGTKDPRHVVKLSRDSTVETQRIASLVLTAFVGPRPTGAEACHGDGDATNDRLDNLRWDTRSGNRRDAIEHGTDAGVRKTRCPRGHLLAPPNLTRAVAAIGRRQCLACNRAYATVAYALRCGESLDLKSEADAHYARIMEVDRCPASSSPTSPSAPPSPSPTR